MSIFTDLRSLVLLRRIARALERSAIADETIARLAVEADDRRVHDSYRPRPQRMTVSSMDLVATNRAWRKQQIESGTRTEDDMIEEFGELPDG